MNHLREVLITITGVKTPDIYLATSYPDVDKNNNGELDRYKVPVYKVYIEGMDDTSKPKKYNWKALRFMPFWNDPKALNTHYGPGFHNAGLSKARHIVVPKYNQNYVIQNTPSEYKGAIQIEGGFLIHAGPDDFNSYDKGIWGSAGCIEIVGNFYDFKRNIQALSGSKKTTEDTAIQELVRNRKLIVHVDAAEAPDFEGKVYEKDRWGILRKVTSPI